MRTLVFDKGNVKACIVADGTLLEIEMPDEKYILLDYDDAMNVRAAIDAAAGKLPQKVKQ